jgi:hypothetical protein
MPLASSDISSSREPESVRPGEVLSQNEMTPWEIADRIIENHLSPYYSHRGIKAAIAEAIRQARGETEPLLVGRSTPHEVKKPTEAK